MDPRKAQPPTCLPLLQQGGVHMFHYLGSTGVDGVSSMLARCVSEVGKRAESSVTQARA